jgi:pimeloyl-ACP methyl ester carboxylesterase
MPALTLLCLPGLGGGTYFFERLAPALAGSCRLVAIDLPLPFSFDAMTELVVDLAQRERASGQAVHLLGHSMGTIVAFEAIRRSPGLTEGVIVVGGLPEPQPESRARIGARADIIRQRGIVGIGADVVVANFSQRSQRERTDLTAWFIDQFERQDPTTYADIADALSAWTARPLPPLDDVSCLVITGEEDRYAPPDAIRTFARSLPASTRVEIMQDCGHLPFLEDPAAFAAIVEAWFVAR